LLPIAAIQTRGIENEIQDLNNNKAKESKTKRHDATPSRNKFISCKLIPPNNKWLFRLTTKSEAQASKRALVQNKVQCTNVIETTVLQEGLRKAKVKLSCGQSNTRKRTTLLCATQLE